MTECPLLKCGGKRTSGSSKRSGHEADGIEPERKPRWGPNDIPTGKQGVEGSGTDIQCFSFVPVGSPALT